MIRTGLIGSAAALAVMIGVWLWAGRAMPADASHIPIHWNFRGEADNFVDRAGALRVFALLPLIGAAIAALFAAIPFLEPLRANLQSSKRAYLIGWIGAEALIALSALALAARALNQGPGFADGTWPPRLAIAGIGVMFAALGDALPKTRPNFFVGVRTPWTLTSDLSWEKTHRLAGRLFVLLGLWCLIAALFVPLQAMGWAVLAPILTATLASVAYSYLIWRGDPDKRQPTRDA